MTRPMQLAIDCHDPHALNRFWADVMQYEIEDHTGQVERLLAEGLITVDDTVLDDGKRVFATAAACRDTSDSGTRMLFQQVPEDKTVKNRVHIDVHAGDERDALIEHCKQLGATWLYDGRQGPQTWVTLADPEGNEFCIS
jgi:hypothetical protein